AAQRMLLRLGIVSRIYEDRRAAGGATLADGGTKTGPVRAQHELVIAGENLLAFRDLIGFADTRKAARLDRALATFKRGLTRERYTAPDFRDDDTTAHDANDVTVPRG